MILNHHRHHHKFWIRFQGNNDEDDLDRPGGVGSSLDFSPRPRPRSVSHPGDRRPVAPEKDDAGNY